MARRSIVTLFTEGSEESDFMPDFEEDSKPFCCAKETDKVLDPNSRYLRLWQLTVAIVCFLSSMLAAYMYSFSSEESWMWPVCYLGDLVFGADLILTFFIGYYNHNGILVSDRRKIVKRYLKGGFIFDFIALFPLAIINFALRDNSTATFTKLRLNRLFLFYRTVGYFVSREEEFGSNTMIFRGWKYGVVCTWVTHCLSCFWYALACNGHHDHLPVHCKVDSWANNTLAPLHTDIPHAPAFHAYIESLYWAIATVTTTGYGDLRPSNIAEMAFGVIAELMGVGVFVAMMLGGMTSMLTNSDQQQGSYVHRFNVIKQHLRDMDCAADLQSQVVGYYEYLWVRKRGILTGDAYDVLPLTFQAEIAHITYNSIIQKAHLFDNCRSGFLRMLSLNIKPCLYLPQQIIMNKGHVGHQMYFVHKGEVEVLSDDENTPVATLKSGKLFGEISLVLSLPRTATIRAATHCDLMVLEKADLQRVLLQYPDIGKHLYEVAKDRCSRAETVVDKPDTDSSQFLLGDVPKAFQRPGTGILEPAPPTLRKSFASVAPIQEEELDEAEGSNTSVAGTQASHYPSVEQRSQLSAAHNADMAADALTACRVSAMNISRHSSRGNMLGPFHRRDSRHHSMMLGESVEVLEEAELENFDSLPFAQRMRGKCLRAVDWFDSITILPNSTILRFWQKLVVVISVIVSFLYTHMASFTLGYGENQGIFAISYIFDFIIAADIFIILRTGIATTHGTKVGFRDIVEHHCKSFSFLLDVLAALPLEVFCIAQADPTARWRLLGFLKLNRVLKVFKVPQEFQKEEELMQGSLLKQRIIKLLCYIALLSHWAACFLYALVCIGESCPEHNWFDDWLEESNRGELQFLSPMTKYIVSLYWATTTMTNTGYGDIHATNFTEQFASTFTMVIGLLIYGYCVASLAATLANMDAPRVRFLEKITAIKEFMRRGDLSPSLRVAVIKQMKVYWQKFGGVWMPGQQALMYDLPDALQQDIAMEDYSWILTQVPLFQDLDDSFLRMLAMKLVSYTFCPGQNIVYAGDLGSEMYLIRRGVCQYVTPGDGLLIAELGQGQYFGDLPLLYGDYHLASVRAKTHVEVLELNAADLWETLEDFPLIKAQFESVKANKQKQKELRYKILSTIREKEDKVGEVVAEVAGPRQRMLFKAPINLGVKSFPKKFADGKLNDDYAAPIRESNGCLRFLSYLLMRITFLPGGLVFVTWQRIMVILPIILAFTTPLKMSFYYYSPPLMYVNLAMDIIAYVCLYLGLHMAYYNEEGVLVTHPLLTAINYLRSYFFLDLFGCFPFDVVIQYTYDRNEEHLIAFARLTRLVQMYRPVMFFSKLDSNIEKPNEHFRFMKIVLYIAIFVHWVTCFLQLAACPPSVRFLGNVRAPMFRTRRTYKCFVNSWLDQQNKINPVANGVLELYSVSLYFAAVTAGSVGYGDIRPHFDHEMLALVFSMISSVLFFGCIIAGIAANISNADTQRTSFQERLDGIRRFLMNHRITGELYDKVISYYENMWERTRGVNPETLFDGVAQSLWGDVTFNLYGNILSKMSLMKGAEKNFIKMLCKCVKPLMVNAGDYIVRKNDRDGEVYFIHKGVIEVVSEDGVLVFETLAEGQSFGEDGWLFNTPRAASIRAKTNSDMYMLSKESLDFVLGSYPKMKAKIIDRAERERNRARRMSKVARQMQYGQKLDEQQQDSMHSVASKLRAKRKRNTQSTNTDPELFSSVDLVIKSRRPVPAASGTTSDAATDDTPVAQGEAIFDNALFPRSLKYHYRRLSAMQDMKSAAPAPKDNNDSDQESMDVKAKDALFEEWQRNENASNNAQCVNRSTIDINEQPVSETAGEVQSKSEVNSTMEKEEDLNSTEVRHGLLGRLRAFTVVLHHGLLGRLRAFPIVLHGLLGRLRTFTIHPTNIYYRRFTETMCLLSFISIWLIIYQMAFQEHMTAVYIVDYIIDVMHLVQIALKFRVSYYENDGDLVEDISKIQTRYLRSWDGFAIDAVAALPLDIFAFAAPSGSKMKTLSFLRLIHLLRYLRLSQFFDQWESELNIQIKFVRSCKFGAIFLLAIHIFSCIWYMAGCPLDECRLVSWTTYSRLQKNAYFINKNGTFPPDDFRPGFNSHFEAYIVSLYWCGTTMTTTGYGDVRAHTVLEMWIATMVIIAGKMLFGLILANIAATLANSEAQRVQHDTKLHAITSHMIDQEVPWDIQKRVIDYHNYLWVRTRGQDPRTLFSDAPYCMQVEIFLAVTRDMLQAIPLLTDLRKSFLRHVCVEVKHLLFMPGDYIVTKGDMGKEMYYIHRGEVEVVQEEVTPGGGEKGAAPKTQHSQQPSTILPEQLLGSGDIFGEVSLVCSVPRRVTVRAKTHVDIFTLSKRSLDAVLESFPEEKLLIEERARERFGHIMEQMRRLGARDLDTSRRMSYAMPRRRSSALPRR